MDSKQALFTLGRKQQQFDLAALNEVDRLVLIATHINVAVFRNLDGARIRGLLLQ